MKRKTDRNRTLTFGQLKRLVKESNLIYEETDENDLLKVGAVLARIDDEALKNKDAKLAFDLCDLIGDIMDLAKRAGLEDDHEINETLRWASHAAYATGETIEDNE